MTLEESKKSEWDKISFSHTRFIIFACILLIFKDSANSIPTVKSDTAVILPIGEISQMVGYQDNLYFSRCFRSYMQMSPTAYRRMPEAYQTLDLDLSHIMELQSLNRETAMAACNKLCSRIKEDIASAFTPENYYVNITLHFLCMLERLHNQEIEPFPSWGDSIINRNHNLYRKLKEILNEVCVPFHLTVPKVEICYFLQLIQDFHLVKYQRKNQLPRRKEIPLPRISFLSFLHSFFPKPDFAIFSKKGH